MTATAPPFAYFGGKQRIAGRIVALLPDHGHYVEPYCGSLSVLLAKPRSRMETVNDLDQDLLTFWRVLRDRPEELVRACALTPHSRAEHLDARAVDVTDELERARRVWVRLAQGRSGQLVKTGWRYYIDAGAKRGFGMPDYLAAYVDRMAAAAERLQHVSLECRPALDVIDAYGAAAHTLLYVDPPYLGSTRGSTYSYQHEMRSEAEHRALADALHGARAAVVLSGYDSDLYEALYSTWYRVEIPAFTNQGNHSDLSRGNARTEVLWSNRPLERDAVLEALFARGGDPA